MIHQERFHRFASRTGDLCTPPCYGGMALSEWVRALESAFGAAVSDGPLPAILREKFVGCSTLLSLQIDGFGWDQFQRLTETDEFLMRLSDAGDIYPITSVFPSTTANALTTFATGWYPQQHGLFEGILLLREFGQPVETLQFRPVGAGERELLVRLGGRSDMLHSGETVFERLAKRGVQSVSFLPSEYADSAYNQAVQRGAALEPFTSDSHLLARLRARLKQASEPTYMTVYWPCLDTGTLQHGPDKVGADVAVARLTTLLSQALLTNIDQNAADRTLVVLTADHGQVPINPAEVTYLNSSRIVEHLAVSPSGDVIPPTGSPRDLFLHIKPGQVEAAVAVLEDELSDTALVMTIEDAVQCALFGPDDHVSFRFKDRAGQILILPRVGHEVWWRYPDKPLVDLRQHGGLSSREMEIPLALGRLSDLNRI